jgi:hypothetical protein
MIDAILVDELLCPKVHPRRNAPWSARLIAPGLDLNLGLSVLHDNRRYKLASRGSALPTTKSGESCALARPADNSAGRAKNR